MYQTYALHLCFNNTKQKNYSTLEIIKQKSTIFAKNL